MKVDDMSVDQLNHAVALANGWKKRYCTQFEHDIYFNDAAVMIVSVCNYTPCTSAEQAYEIIEHERIGVIPNKSTQYPWEAFIFGNCEATGKTALIAAMRCYVKSKLGDKMEL